MNVLSRLMWIGLTTVALATALMCSCVVNLGRCSSSPVVGRGPVQSQSRPLSGPVRTIIAGGNVRLQVVVDEQPALTVRASADLLPYLETRQDGDVLHIGYRTGICLADDGEPVVRVATPGFHTLQLGGACRAEADGCQGSTATIDLTGASRATVRGKAGTVQVDCSGASQADLAGLAAGDWQVDCSGASRCTLAGAASQADLEASGASHIAAGQLRVRRAEARASGASGIVLGRVDSLRRQESGAGTIEAEAP